MISELLKALKQVDDVNIMTWNDLRMTFNSERLLERRDSEQPVCLMVMSKGQYKDRDSFNGWIYHLYIFHITALSLQLYIALYISSSI